MCCVELGLHPPQRQNDLGGVSLDAADVVYQRVDGERTPVGDAVPHATALQHATGEAIFVDDIDPPRGSLEAACVSSTKPHARVIAIDASAALALPGVRGYFDHKDLAERKEGKTCRIADDKDHVFADGLVTCVGMLIGIVVADSLPLAKLAAKLVVVEYEELPAVLSIAEALAAVPPSLHKYSHCVVDGDVEAALTKAPHVLSGEQRVGAQEHFYLEPHALLAVPEERAGEITIHSCTQCVAKTVKVVAGCLGVNESNVRCVVKRIGGGFGGKETLSTFRAGAIAVAADKLRRAVR